MRKIALILVSLFGFLPLSADTPQSEISFEKLVHDFGKFSEKEPVQKCTFVFKNIGDAPLIIKQVITSCGCTTRTFTEEPVMPGEKGQINITYDGKGRYTKPFRKIITVESNAKTKYVRLHVVGQMTAAKTEK